MSEADDRTERHVRALVAAAVFLIQAKAPSETISALIEIIDDLLDTSAMSWTVGHPGKKPQKFTHRVAMARFAAAVTVLKRERGIEGAIADVATANNISRKGIKTFRDRLNRGRADYPSSMAYKSALADYESKSKAEIMLNLRVWAKRICT